MYVNLSCDWQQKLRPSNVNTVAKVIVLQLPNKEETSQIRGAIIKTDRCIIYWVTSKYAAIFVARIPELRL
jgi:hypothetical protein